MGDKKIRMTSIYLREDQIERLNAHSGRLRVPKSILIRAAVDVALFFLDNCIALWDGDGKVITEKLERVRDEMHKV